MVSLTVLFYILIGLFAIIGSTRGRTKEFLVSLAAVVAIFLNAILDQYAPGYMAYLTKDTPAMLFYVRGAIVFIVVLLGYLTPKLPQIFVNQSPIGKIKDAFWGLFFGALNGYLIVGSIWSYMHDAAYPIPAITAPDAATAFGKAALNMISALPPHIFTPPGIYFVVAAAFIIILGAFV
jgi:hypothetical protein